MEVIKIEELRTKVILKGQRDKDKRKLAPGFVWQIVGDVSLPLQWQIERDARAGYKYYDALAMWLGQAKFWTEQDRAFLVSLAKKYLEGGETK